MLNITLDDMIRNKKKEQSMVPWLTLKWVKTYRLDPVNPDVPQKHDRSQYAKSLHYSYFKGWGKVGAY